MDSIPNEMLLQIIGCLKKEEIPKMRLISKRFNLLAATWMQKLYPVQFANDSEISEFMTIFENKAVVPFKKFEFSRCLLQYGQLLEQFCFHFGILVKYLSVVMDSGPRTFGENSVSKNLEILLENCVNVEQIVYCIEEFEKYPQIPTLRNTITITKFHGDNKNFFPLLHQIVQKAPNIRRVSIQNLVVHQQSDLETTADILNQLYNLKETVHIQKLRINLLLPVPNIGDLAKLVATSTQFRIVDLELDISVKNPHSEQSPQTVKILSKWIQNLKSIRKFCVTYSGGPNYHVPLAMPLYFLSNLQSLKLCGEISVHIPVVPGQKMEFPVLSSLICRLHYEFGNNFIFSGCVFPNVKFAQINLKTEEDCEQWTYVIPNVEELLVSVSSETLKGIFRFPRLRKLDITMGLSGQHRYDDVVRRHWTHLTGGAEYVSDGSILSFPVTTRDTSDSIDSFQKLPLLTDLKFRGGTVECWKGIIYASRTGQLRRLQNLVLTPKDFPMAKSYRTILMQYHDIVVSSSY